jgi:protein-disulfide isomerase
MAILARLALAAALLLPSLPAAALDDAEREEVGKLVREYLLKNPEVLVEAQQELEKRTQAQADAKAQQVLAEKRGLIERSERQVTIGNPVGDVTLVEFFDYNCGYCKRAHGDMNTLIKNDPQLRVVLKEFPVLGEGSLEAAQVAVAVNLAAPDKYEAFHETLLMGRGAADKARALAAAKEVGVDQAKLTAAMASPDVRKTIEESYSLANALGLTGTPAYVIGDQIVSGARGAEYLAQRVADLRKCGKATC